MAHSWVGSTLEHSIYAPKIYFPSKMVHSWIGSTLEHFIYAPTKWHTLKVTPTLWQFHFNPTDSFPTTRPRAGLRNGRSAKGGPLRCITVTDAGPKQAFRCLDCTSVLCSILGALVTEICPLLVFNQHQASESTLITGRNNVGSVVELTLTIWSRASLYFLQPSLKLSNRHFKTSRNKHYQFWYHGALGFVTNLLKCFREVCPVFWRSSVYARKNWQPLIVWSTWIREISAWPWLCSKIVRIWWHWLNRHTKHKQFGEFIDFWTCLRRKHQTLQISAITESVRS